LPAAAALSAALLFLPASVTAKGGGAHGSYSTGTHGHAPAAGVALEALVQQLHSGCKANITINRRLAASHSN
jgi:hypothetical protein